jgi:hypothetical protein
MLILSLNYNIMKKSKIINISKNMKKIKISNELEIILYKSEKNDYYKVHIKKKEANQEIFYLNFSNIKKLYNIFSKNYSNIIYNNTNLSLNASHIINKYLQELCKECYNGQISYLLIICNQENRLCQNCLINKIISLVKKKLT